MTTPRRRTGRSCSRCGSAASSSGWRRRRRSSRSGVTSPRTRRTSRPAARWPTPSSPSASGRRPSATWKPASRGRPDDARAWRDYLTMLQSLGEQEAFNAALARVPKSGDAEPEIWMFRGEIKERDGDWAGAAADYRRALELNPNLLNGQYRLATVEARLGHREQAAAHRKRWDQLREARVQLRQADDAVPRRRRRRVRAGARSVGKGRAPGRRPAAGLGLRGTRLGPRRGGLQPDRRHSLKSRRPGSPALTGQDDSMPRSAIGPPMALAFRDRGDFGPGGRAWWSRSGRTPTRSARGRAAYDRGDWEAAADLARARLKAEGGDRDGVRLLARAAARLGRDDLAARCSTGARTRPSRPRTSSCWGWPAPAGQAASALKVWEMPRAPTRRMPRRSSS